MAYPAFTQGSCTTFYKELAPLLKGIRLIILTDNDSDGQKGAQRLRDSLLPYADLVKIIIPCTDFLKADVTNYFEKHDKNEFEQLIAENMTVTKNRRTGEHSPAPAKNATLVDKLIELGAANKYPLTDIGSASLFSAVFKDKHRYNVTAKDWFFYDGQRWILDREGLRARKSAKELSKALSVYAVNHLPDEDEKKKEQYLKYALTWTYSRTQNAIIQDSRDLNFISNEELDADDYVLNLRNCVLVFHEDRVEKKEHSADLLLSKIANAEYNPGAKCERWEQFLDEVMQGDKDKIHYLRKAMIYGYVRVSTVKQKVERQIANIKKVYPAAVIIDEAYTGTSMSRPKWNKLIKALKPGDTIVFDEVSRMARTAQEGFETYLELYNKGINLIFLKERHIDTDVFRQALESKIALTGSDVDCILQGVNEYLMILAKKQIEIAFNTAEQEVDYLHMRVKEGVARARAAGKQIGRAEGATIETKKAKQAKQEILKHSKDFNGTLNDIDCMKLTGLSRNTFYKYKKQLKENM